MKRNLLAIAAILLALVMLAGCAAQEPHLGSISGAIYASSDAELTFITPNGWEYATNELITAAKHSYVDKMRGSGILVSDEMLENSYIFDMVAVDTETGTNALVFYQNLALIPDGTNYTEDRYLDATREAGEKVKQGDYEFGDYTDEIIGPNTYRMMPMNNKDNGFSQYLYVRRKGAYMLCIAVTITDGSDLGSVMENFSWIDGQIE